MELALEEELQRLEKLKNKASDVEARASPQLTKKASNRASLIQNKL